MAEDKSGKKMIAVNREVRHEYFVVEALETGIALVGTEVKSLRAGGVNLKDSWADIEDGELIAKGIQVSIGHRAENIEGADCLIRTAAAHNDNPEIAAKLEADIRRDFHKLMSNQSKVAARAAGRAVDVSADDFDDAD